MIKTFRIVKVSLLLVILFGSALAITFDISGDNASAALRDRPKIFSFRSYIDIEVDTTPLNENLDIDQSISIPVTVKYWTDVPENFLQFAPWWLRNTIIFGSPIGPMQEIELEIIDAPDWADIKFTEESVITNIPIGGQTGTVSVQTTLVLSPYVEAGRSVAGLTGPT